MEDENIGREKKIIAILNEELEDGANLAKEARKIVEYLLLEKKGYGRGDIRKSVVFDVQLEKEIVPSSVDFLIVLEGRNAMAIKCAAGSLSSRERQAIAAARLLAVPPVPIAVVADPTTAEVLDVSNGKIIGEGFGAIPVREQLLSIMKDKEPEALSPKRIEMEKRILLAFDAIRCSIPRGGDGGVALDKERDS